MKNWNPINDAEPLLFEKELLPTGDFVKWIDKENELPIRVRRDFLEHLVSDFDKMKEVGVKVPLYKTHREDPDNNRGEVVGIEIRQNAAGIDALFGKIQFNDEAARDQGIHNDVSVGIPPFFKDGKGNEYEHPLRHVALTDHPVIPGLSAFMPMVLSFDTPTGLLESGAPFPPQFGKRQQPGAPVPPVPQVPVAQTQVPVAPPAPPAQPNPPAQEDSSQNESSGLDLLLQLLGITPDAVASDEEKIKLAIESVQANKMGMAGVGTPQTVAGAPPLVIQPPATTTAKGKMNLSHADIPPVLISQLQKAHEQIIDGLVKDEYIDLQQSQSLKKDYCTPEALSLELSHMLETGETKETEFDRIISFAKKNHPLAKSGRSTTIPTKGIALSHFDNDAPTPLVADMRRRRELAANGKK